MHRSTQTIHQRNDADLIEDYSLRGVSETRSIGRRCHWACLCLDRLDG